MPQAAKVDSHKVQPAPPQTPQGASAHEKQLAAARTDVFGDDPVRERGIGSKYQEAPREDRLRLAMLEARAPIDEMVGLANSLKAAADKVIAAQAHIAEVATS